MNILRFKQRAQGWMAREDGGDSGGTSYSDSDSSGFGPPQSSQNYNNSDASAYGGKESGFAPDSGVSSEYTGNFEGSGWSGSNTGVTAAPGTGDVSYAAQGPQDQFSYLKQLSDMFSTRNIQGQPSGITNSLNQLAVSGPESMGVTDVAPTDRDTLSKLGISSYSQLGQYAKENNLNLSSILGHEVSNTGLRTLANTGYGDLYGANPNNLTGQNVNHMIAAGNVSDAIGNIGQSLLHAATPAPIRLGMGLASAYKSWDSAKPMESAGRALGGLPGYFGAAGQAMQGNYGSALAGGLTKSGASPMTAAGLGMGLDASQGKDVRAPATGLAAYYAGSQLGGPVGGVLGQNLARMYTRKK